jgi:hypothetical protein
MDDDVPRGPCGGALAPAECQEGSLSMAPRRDAEEAMDDRTAERSVKQHVLIEELVQRMAAAHGVLCIYTPGLHDRVQLKVGYKTEALTVTSTTQHDLLPKGNLSVSISISNIPPLL